MKPIFILTLCAFLCLSATHSFAVNSAATVSKIKDALQKTNRYEKSHDLYKIVSSFDTATTQEFLEKHLSEFSQNDSYELSSCLYLCWADEDPEGATRYAYDQELYDSNPHLFYDIISSWAKLEPATVSKFTDTRPMGSAQSHVINFILSQWVLVDHEASIAWAQKNLSDYSLFESLVQQVMVVADTDPHKAIKIADATLSGPPKDQAYTSIARIWSQTDVEAAFKWAQGLPEGALKNAALGACIPELQKTDLDAALAFINTLLNDIDTWQSTIRDFAYQWEHSDPEAVLKWHKSLPESQLKNDILMDTIIVWGDHNPAECAEYILSQDKNFQQRFIGRLAQSWCYVNIDDAVAWAESLPVVEETGGAMSSRDTAFSTVLPMLAERAPAKAAKYYDKNIKDSNKHIRTVEAITENWTRIAPEATASWIKTLSEPMSKSSALDKLIRGWQSNGNAPIIEWMSKQTDLEFKDQFATQFVNNVLYDDAAIAFKVAQNIHNAENKTQLIERTFQRYHSVNPKVALDALSDSDSISEEEANRLIESVQSL